QSPYEYYNGTLCVRKPFLVDEVKIVSYENYKKLVNRGHFNVLRNGKGLNNYALICWRSIKDSRPDIAEKIEAFEPAEKATVSILESYITHDGKAYQYFSEYRKQNGEPLSTQQQRLYTTNATLLNAASVLRQELLDRLYTIGGTKQRVREVVSKAVNTVDTTKYLHNLPSSPRKLEAKILEYGNNNYEILIDGNVGNQHRSKIKKNPQIADWLLAQYCLPNKISIPELLEKYNKKRTIMQDWESLTNQAIYNYLEEKEVKRIWMLARHGKSDYNNLFQHKTTRDKSNWYPNVYWALDGSKLDWVYTDEDGKLEAKAKVILVADVYSEKIIGYSLSKTENHVDAFVALKSAVKTTGVRPLFINYDNQAGNKSKRMQELFSALVAKDGGTHFPNKAYSHANPMEQLFGRIQKKFNKWWFSDKQSIKAKRLDHQMNVDFIKANKHQLYVYEELEHILAYSVEQWNNSKHSTIEEQTRNEVSAHTMAKREEYSNLDIAQSFWLNETRPIFYKAGGLQLTVAGKTITYEVYDDNGDVDIEFRRRHVTEKFIVRYDPEFLDSYVQLMREDEKGQRYLVAVAEPKRGHESVPGLMQEGDRAAWLRDYAIQEMELQRDQAALEALRLRTGITEQTLIDEQDLEQKFKGQMPKELRGVLEENEGLTRL
ncbi:MAG: hypothetical protein RQ875_09450, partial [Vicingaceae bacterium]|nr:hypothetical protein [Vicingaceae bacterium]